MLSTTAAMSLDLVGDIADRVSANIELRRRHLAAAVRAWPHDRLAASVHMRRVLSLKRKAQEGGA